jgi:hypothetical protein
MKSKIMYITRVMLALVLYVCCSSVVCCEACMHTTSAVSLQDENIKTIQEEYINTEYNTPAVDEEDSSPLSIGLIRLTELL